MEFLGWTNQSYINDFTKGFKIYLHEKGQFWPGLEMDSIGQTKSIYIPGNTEVWGSFTAAQKINLNKNTAPCVDDHDYSFTNCMKEYVARKAGCHLDWVDKHSNEKMGPCKSWEEVQTYKATLGAIR